MSIENYVLHLYPRPWRERYGEEFLAMLEQRPLSFLDGLDLLRGALDAHLHPALSTTGMPRQARMAYLFTALRSSVLTIFCAYVGFILAGMGFQKLTEDAQFQQVAQTWNLVGLAFHLVVMGAVVALLAVTAGGLPIVAAVIRSALARRRYAPLCGLAVPFLAFAVFLSVTLFLETINRPGTQHFWQFFAHQGLFFGTVLATAIASPSAICFAVARSEVPVRLLRFAVRVSTLVISAMALVLAATIAWGLGLRASAPQLFASNDGVLRTSTAGSWLGIVLAMALATVVAALLLLRGLSACSALRTVAAET